MAGRNSRPSGPQEVFKTAGSRPESTTSPSQYQHGHQLAGVTACRSGADLLPARNPHSSARPDLGNRLRRTPGRSGGPQPPCLGHRHGAYWSVSPWPAPCRQVGSSGPQAAGPICRSVCENRSSWSESPVRKREERRKRNCCINARAGGLSGRSTWRARRGIRQTTPPRGSRRQRSRRKGQTASGRGPAGRADK